DQHGAVMGARAAVPAAVPQRRDQRDPRQRELDARAGQFRLLCHNGEINAIRGNVNWMRARAGSLDGIATLDETSSDSGMLDNATELLVRGGRDIRHALAMLVPPAWQNDPELDPDVRAFHSYHAGLVEPWNGPAGIVFSDGRVVGAALDRNRLPP